MPADIQQTHLQCISQYGVEDMSSLKEDIVIIETHIAGVCMYEIVCVFSMFVCVYFKIVL